MSYTQIKNALGVSKSTLSGWLKEQPLSKDRIAELGSRSAARIEKFRNTMKKKGDQKKLTAYHEVSKNINKLSDRDIFIGGLFLYWAEGGKTNNSTVVLTNTNPKMLKFYISWLNMLGVSKDKLKIKLHLYSDMVVEKEVDFWSNELDISKNQFRKTYIKKSLLSKITYKNGYNHGTCCVIYGNKPLFDYVLMGLKRLQEFYQ